MTDAHVRWHDLDPAEVEIHFNPRMAVADAAERLERWAGHSAAMLDGLDVRQDIRYGAGPRMTLDVYPAAKPDAPVVVFVHGGYWRRLAKSDHVFAADGLRKMGASVVALNYDLCPSVTLTALNAEIAGGIRYVAEHAGELGLGGGRFIVAGHSAGGHAAAFAAADPSLVPLVAGTIPISGIFDTRALLHTTINDDVRLDADEADRMNVFGRPPGEGLRALVIVGGDEPPAWIGESAAYCDHVRSHGGSCSLEIASNADHFSVLEAACDIERPLGQKVAAFIREVGQGAGSAQSP